MLSVIITETAISIEKDQNTTRPPQYLLDTSSIYTNF